MNESAHPTLMIYRTTWNSFSHLHVWVRTPFLFFTGYLIQTRSSRTPSRVPYSSKTTWVPPSKLGPHALCGKHALCHSASGLRWPLVPGGMLEMLLKCKLNKYGRQMSACQDDIFLILLIHWHHSSAKSLNRILVKSIWPSFHVAWLLVPSHLCPPFTCPSPPSIAATFPPPNFFHF